MSEYDELLERMRRQGQSPLKAPRGAQPDPTPDQFDEFVEFLRSGQYPKFSRVIWTGETYYVELSLKLDLDSQATAQQVREQVAEQLRKLSLLEKKILNIDILIKNRKPVQAIVTMQPEFTRLGVVRLGTGLLRELQEGPG